MLTDARQLQVKLRLVTLRLRTFMQDRKHSEISKGLIKLIEHIDELFLQCPLDFRTETQKIEYLQKAATKYQSWSIISIQNTNSQEYSLNKYVTAPNDSIQNLPQIQLLTSQGSKISEAAVVENEEEI